MKVQGNLCSQIRVCVVRAFWYALTREAYACVHNCFILVGGSAGGDGWGCLSKRLSVLRVCESCIWCVGGLLVCEFVNLDCGVLVFRCLHACVRAYSRACFEDVYAWMYGYW